jgi:hypothetical protein
MAEPILINPPPKIRFLTDGKRVTAHRNIFQMPQVEDSINTALLEYQRLLLGKSQIEMSAAATSGLKLAGALEFADILIKLGESYFPKAVEKMAAQLDHTV